MWLPSPHLTHSFIFSLAFLHLSQEGTPYSSVPPSPPHPEACLVVGCLCKCRFLGSSWPRTLDPLVADPRIFILVSSLWVRVPCPQVLRTPALVQLPLASVMSDETSIMQCFFWSALLLKSRLLVGQNRLSPCKWGVKGHNFMGSHLSLSQRHFRLVVCLRW